MAVTKKELLGSELMREILRIRIDTLWSMLGLLRDGRHPPVDAEKSTGDLDDKGGLFVPGGLVLHDWEGNPVRPVALADGKAATFRSAVRVALRHDGAHLLSAAGVARAKLGNSAFARMSSSILHNRREALRRRRRLGEHPPARIGSRAISKSHCPPWVPAPFGSRTSLSSDLAVCLCEPRMYFLQCLEYYELRAAEAEALWQGIKESRQPVLGDDGVVLAPPLVVTCHNTRYREANLIGLTRLCGFGRFGEFATISAEPLGTDLLHELEVGRERIAADEIVATYDGIEVALVLRVYPRTNPGARLLKGVTTSLISAERDLGLDVEAITEEARERYDV